MLNVLPLHRAALSSSIRVQHDAAASTHWCFMHCREAFEDPDYRTCFSPVLLRDLRMFAAHATADIDKARDTAHGAGIAHIVLASDAHVFNLGGDISLFAQLIQARDRTSLLSYAHECIDSLYLLYSRIHRQAHTVALVQGDALGGGFELALACQTIVAESGVQLGFPEVLFGLFPGMGAYHLLKQRVSPKLAEEMMLNGRMYSSDELHRMGVVDILVPAGTGKHAVDEYIKSNRRISGARMALHRIRENARPISRAELDVTVEIWVDTAMQLDDKKLRVMDRLARAQLRRPASLATTG